MADLGCSPNAAIAFDFLVGKGLKDFQAAAIIGNLQQESRLDPSLEAMDSNNLMSRGIAMWQPKRWQNLITFASGENKWDLGTQLNFLWHELQTDPSLGIAALISSSTLEDATVVFQDRFERPLKEKAATQNRIAYAKSVLFACPGVKLPAGRRIAGIVTATISIAALAAATGYSVFRALKDRVPQAPEPISPPPAFRPDRPTW